MLITDYIINYFKFGILGNSIRIDASNACQLRCPTCHQVKEGEYPFKRRYLKFRNFKKFVDQYPTFRNIELSGNGEIFLNPELEEIIQYAFTKKIALTVRNGVNLSDVSERVLECLVKYKVRILLVSIDGATEETYQIHRQGGNFQKVLENINIINQFKQQYRSKFPVLIWQFIVFGHNEHEIPLARKTAQKLNMRFFLKFNMYPDYSPVKDVSFIRKEMGYHSIAEYEEKTNNIYVFPCHQLWLTPQISPDGDFLGCCYNKKENVYGNIFDLGVEQVLKSDKFNYAKRMLLGLSPAREDIPCTNCDVYKKLRSKKVNPGLTFLSLLNRLKNTHL